MPNTVKKYINTDPRHSGLMGLRLLERENTVTPLENPDLEPIPIQSHYLVNPSYWGNTTVNGEPIDITGYRDSNTGIARYLDGEYGYVNLPDNYGEWMMDGVTIYPERPRLKGVVRNYFDDAQLSKILGQPNVIAPIGVGDSEIQPIQFSTKAPEKYHGLDLDRFFANLLTFGTAGTEEYASQLFKDRDYLKGSIYAGLPLLVKGGPSGNLLRAGFWGYNLYNDADDAVKMLKDRNGWGYGKDVAKIVLDSGALLYDLTKGLLDALPYLLDIARQRNNMGYWARAASDITHHPLDTYRTLRRGTYVHNSPSLRRAVAESKLAVREGADYTRNYYLDALKVDMPEANITAKTSIPGAWGEYIPGTTNFNYTFYRSPFSNLSRNARDFKRVGGHEYTHLAEEYLNNRYFFPLLSVPAKPYYLPNINHPIMSTATADDFMEGNIHGRSPEETWANYMGYNAGGEDPIMSFADYNIKKEGIPPPRGFISDYEDYLKSLSGKALLKEGEIQLFNKHYGLKALGGTITNNSDSIILADNNNYILDFKGRQLGLPTVRYANGGHLFGDGDTVETTLKNYTGYTVNPMYWGNMKTTEGQPITNILEYLGNNLARVQYDNGTTGIVEYPLNFVLGIAPEVTVYGESRRPSYMVNYTRPREGEELPWHHFPSTPEKIDLDALWSIARKYGLLLPANILDYERMEKDEKDGVLPRMSDEEMLKAYNEAENWASSYYYSPGFQERFHKIPELSKNRRNINLGLNSFEYNKDTNDFDPFKPYHLKAVKYPLDSDFAIREPGYPIANYLDWYYPYTSQISVATPHLGITNYDDLVYALTHEFGHGIDNAIRMSGVLGEKEFPVGNRASSVDYSSIFPVFWNSKALNKIGLPSWYLYPRDAGLDAQAMDYPTSTRGYDVHDGKPSESYADLIAFRKLAEDLGVFDSKKAGQKFTKDMLDQIKIKVALDKNRSRSFRYRLMDNFSDDDIIWMMNNIAQNNEPIESKELSSDRALYGKYGGSLAQQANVFGDGGNERTHLPRVGDSWRNTETDEPGTVVGYAPDVPYMGEDGKLYPTTSPVVKYDSGETLFGVIPQYTLPEVEVSGHLRTPADDLASMFADALTGGIASTEKMASDQLKEGVNNGNWRDLVGGTATALSPLMFASGPLRPYATTLFGTDRLFVDPNGVQKTYRELANGNYWNAAKSFAGDVFNGAIAGVGAYGIADDALNLAARLGNANAKSIQFARALRGDIKGTGLEIGEPTGEIIRTKLGDVEINNPNLFYRLDGGDHRGAFSKQGAYIEDNLLHPGPPKRSNDVGYTWWSKESPYTYSEKKPWTPYSDINEGNIPSSRLIVTSEGETPSLLHVQSQNYQIGQWTGKRGLVGPREYVTPEPVKVSDNVYTWEPSYGYRKATQEPSTISWEDAVSPLYSEITAESPKISLSPAEPVLVEGIQPSIGTPGNPYYWDSDLKLWASPEVGAKDAGAGKREYIDWVTNPEYIKAAEQNKEEAEAMGLKYIPWYERPNAREELDLQIALKPYIDKNSNVGAYTRLGHKDNPIHYNMYSLMSLKDAFRHEYGHNLGFATTLWEDKLPFELARESYQKQKEYLRYKASQVFNKDYKYPVTGPGGETIYSSIQYLPWEVAMNMRDMGVDLGIKVGEEYPGFEKALKMINEYNGPKMELKEGLNLTREALPYVWKALNGTQFMLVVPYIGIGAAATGYGLYDNFNNTNSDIHAYGGPLVQYANKFIIED